MRALTRALAVLMLFANHDPATTRCTCNNDVNSGSPLFLKKKPPRWLLCNPHWTRYVFLLIFTRVCPRGFSSPSFFLGRNHDGLITGGCALNPHAFTLKDLSRIRGLSPSLPRDRWRTGRHSFFLPRDNENFGAYISRQHARWFPGSSNLNEYKFIERKFKSCRLRKA